MVLKRPLQIFNGFWGDHHHWMFLGSLTIAINGFTMVFWCCYHRFQWFSMVLDHWSNDAMVSMDRCGLMWSLKRKILLPWAATKPQRLVFEWRAYKERDNKLLYWGVGVCFGLSTKRAFLLWEKNELGRYECFPRGPGSGVVDHHVMRDDL